MRARLLTVGLVAAAVVSSVSAVGASGAVRERAGATTCVAGSIRTLGTRDVSYAAVALRRLHARPALNQRSATVFETTNVNGVRTVFAVLKERVDRRCTTTHYKVQLPVRPNGAVGWVRATDVQLRAVHTRILVDLSQRRVTLFRRGRVLLLTTAVIGAPSTPTPTGRFYVNQRLRTTNPLGEFGPGAVGISAFSPVLLNWPQGGPIAIHGTDAPGLIGSAVSYGCVRVRNNDAERLLRLAVEGTPVDIRA